MVQMLERELPSLMPMPAPFDGDVEKPARVSRTGRVAVARNRYSVPCERAGRRVSTRRYPERVVIVAGDAIVASHARLRDPGQTAYDGQHDVPRLERKPGALRNGAPFADLPAPLLPPVATTLSVATPPVADPARYDLLREGGHA